MLVAQLCPTLWPHGLYPTRLLSPWNSPGKNTGVCSHFLLQGIFPTQGLNLALPYCRLILYHLNHQGSPWGRMDTCMCMAEFIRCSPEITTTLLIDYTPIQNKKFKVCKTETNITSAKAEKSCSRLFCLCCSVLLWPSVAPANLEGELWRRQKCEQASLLWCVWCLLSSSARALLHETKGDRILSTY